MIDSQLSLSINHVARGRSFMLQVHEDIKCTINIKIFDVKIQVSRNTSID